MKSLSARSSALMMAVFLFSPRAGGQDESQPFARFADSLMSEQLAKHDIPGAVLVVVRDGRVAFARGYGYADLERRISVDAERTMFRVASVSKLFTATAAMQLVEQGRLRLDADVNDSLRRFKVPSTYPRPVTLFHLLTHTAGFDESNIARKAHQPSEVDPLGDYLARRLPARIRPAGELIVYSNHGMALAGYLVETASGMPFEKYMRERIFAPLGMAHSSFQLVPDPVAHMATGYEGSPPLRQAPDYTKTIPASMLSTSGADVARFMIAHLDGGAHDATRLLSPAGLEAMHRRQFTQHPLLAGIGLGFWERFQSGERGLWHDGDASGFASLLYLVPERRTGYFMAFNSRAGNRARHEVLAALLDRDSPQTRSPPAPTPETPVAEPSSQLAGTYGDLRYGHRTMEKIVALMRQTTVRQGGGGTLAFADTRYAPIGSQVFRSEDGEGHLAFRVDRTGRATHLFESRSIARVYERLPWYGTVKVQLAWLLLCVLGFVWHTASALYRSIVRRRQHRPATIGPVAERWVTGATLFVSAASLTFIVGLGFAIAGAFGSLEYGIPIAVIVLLTVPLVTTALTLVSLLKFARAWRRGEWSGSKARPVLALAAALAFVPWLAYWNLIGYHF